MSKFGLKFYSGVVGVSYLTLAIATAPAHAGGWTNVSNCSGFNHTGMGGWQTHKPHGGWNGSNGSGHGKDKPWWNGSNMTGHGKDKPWWNGSNGSGYGKDKPWWNGGHGGHGGHGNGNGGGDYGNGGNGNGNGGGDYSNGGNGDGGKDVIVKNPIAGSNDGDPRNRFSGPKAWDRKTLFAGDAMELQDKLAATQQKYDRALALLAEAQNAEAQNTKLVSNAGPVRFSRANADIAACGCGNNNDAASTPSPALLAAKAAEAQAAGELDRVKAEVRQFLEYVKNTQSEIVQDRVFTPVW